VWVIDLASDPIGPSARSRLCGVTQHQRPAWARAEFHGRASAPLFPFITWDGASAGDEAGRLRLAMGGNNNSNNDKPLGRTKYLERRVITALFLSPMEVDFTQSTSANYR
jgi:hypothetical protein